jgi:3-hydroxy acid dehydrogenase / malonic semialdehyde reductase
MAISLKNKIVFVTGASSGIGEACAKIFAEHGANIILCARRRDRIEKLAADLSAQHKVKCYTLELDVSNRTAVEKAIAALPADWQDIEVLINNAGLALGMNRFHEGNIDDWEKMIDTNVKGLLYVTHAIVPHMIKRNSGHVINIGSVAGHEVYPNGNVYSATKHAVYALTKAFKMDLHGTDVRVSSVDPGMTETEFSIVRWNGDTDIAKKFYSGMQPLIAEDVADVVYFCASRPKHVNILDIVMMPTAQSAAMQVHRKA